MQGALLEHRAVPVGGAPHLRPDEAFRAQMLAAIPAWYSPLGHLLSTTGIGAAVLAVSIANVEGVRWFELLAMPVVLVISNCVEWFAHKYLLHRRSRPVQVLYDRHTPEHHRVYRHGDMAMRSFRELRLVLIPAVGVLTIILTMVPLAALSGVLFGANVGWLFLVTSSSYVVTYELTHLLYHLPASYKITQLSVVRALSEHHARHHDPRLMQRWNFNVTLPLADWMFGTLARKAPEPSESASQ